MFNLLWSYLMLFFYITIKIVTLLCKIGSVKTVDQSLLFQQMHQIPHKIET